MNVIFYQRIEVKTGRRQAPCNCLKRTTAVKVEKQKQAPRYQRLLYSSRLRNPTPKLNTGTLINSKQHQSFSVLASHEARADAGMCCQISASDRWKHLKPPLRLPLISNKIVRREPSPQVRMLPRIHFASC